MLWSEPAQTELVNWFQPGHAVESGRLHGNLHLAWQFLNSNINLAMKNVKTGKTTMITCLPFIFKILNWSLNMKSDQNSDLWDVLHSCYKFLQKKILINVDFTKLSLRNITGRKFCRISYLTTVLESWIQGQKILSLFSGFRLFHG